MARRGTKARIDLGELEKLCAMQCTDEEIAAWFGVTTRTIERRRKNRVFREVIERGKAKGRISVRRAQLKLLEAGNATMGVWLGKQFLGQTDQLLPAFDGGAHITIVIPRSATAPGLGMPELGSDDGSLIDVEVEQSGQARHAQRL